MVGRPPYCQRVPASLARLLFPWLACLGLAACKHQEPVCTEPVIYEAVTPPRALKVETTVQALTPPPPTAAPATVKTEPLAPTPAPVLQISPAVLSEQLTRPASTAAPRSKLLLGFEHFLNNRQDEAVAGIKGLPTDDQDVILTVLPILASIDHGELWPNLTGPEKLARLEALRGLIKRLAKTAPLVMKKSMYINKIVDVKYGELKPRDNTTFHPEDWVSVYAELTNLVETAGADGLYNAHVYTTIEIRGEDNQVYYNSDRQPSQRPGSISPRTDYYILAWFTLPKGLPAGAYQLVMKVEDFDTGRSAKQTLPLNIVPRPRAKAAK